MNFDGLTSSNGQFSLKEFTDQGTASRSDDSFDEDISYFVHSCRGIDFIEYLELSKVESRIRHYDFEDFVEHLVDSYDLLLWDLPDLIILDHTKEILL